MNEAEQRDNRIALWQREILDLIPDNIESDLANPKQLLADLIADVTAKAIDEEKARNEDN